MGRKGAGLEVLCGVKNARNTGGRCFNVHCALSVGNGVCCTAKAVGAHRNAVAVARCGVLMMKILEGLPWVTKQKFIKKLSFYLLSVTFYQRRCRSTRFLAPNCLRVYLPD